MTGYSFTDAVRRSLQAAREEAVQLQHEYVGTEHLLLGLLRPTSGMAFTILTNLSVDPAVLWQSVLIMVKRGPGTYPGPDLPYTARGKKVLELAMTEARELGHDYVGTEHLLLGLLREEKGIGAQVLVGEGLSVETVRAEALRIHQSADLPSRPAEHSRPSAVTIITEYDNGRLGAKKFASVKEAMGYLTQLDLAP